MALLITYSPPSTPKGETIESEDFPDLTCIVAFLIRQAVIDEETSERLSIVFSLGSNGKHPHIHALYHTSTRGDNLRRKIIKEYKIPIKEYPNLLQVKTAKADGGWYPAKKYLVTNSHEKGGYLVRDDHELARIDASSENTLLRSIARRQLVAELYDYVAGYMSATDETYATKHTFLSAVGDVVSRGYDVTPHLTHLDAVYHQVLMMTGTCPSSLNLLKD